MKLKFDLTNKRHVGFMLMSMSFLILGIQIMEFEAERRLPGLAALALILISTVFLIFLTSHRLKTGFICVWVVSVAFLTGYFLTTIILA